MSSRVENRFNSGIEVSFSNRPAKRKYDVCPALGLTDEAAAALPVSASYEDQGGRPCVFTARVENGRLVLVNGKPGGTYIIVK